MIISYVIRVSRASLFLFWVVKGLINEYDNTHKTMWLDRLKAKLRKFYFTLSDSAEFRALSTSCMVQACFIRAFHDQRQTSVLLW